MKLSTEIDKSISAKSVKVYLMFILSFPEGQLNIKLIQNAVNMKELDVKVLRNSS